MGIILGGKSLNNEFSKNARQTGNRFDSEKMFSVPSRVYSPVFTAANYVNPVQQIHMVAPVTKLSGLGMDSAGAFCAKANILTYGTYVIGADDLDKLQKSGTLDEYKDNISFFETGGAADDHVALLNTQSWISYTKERSVQWGEENISTAIEGSFASRPEVSKVPSLSIV